jgi:hypothetical protein
MSVSRPKQPPIDVFEGVFTQIKITSDDFKANSTSAVNPKFYCDIAFE